MLPQPVPQVSDGDVERIVRRDYSEHERGGVMAVLEQYGTQSPESARVRLAALKMAARDLDKLRYWISEACADYRDVLMPAEYPQYSRAWSRFTRLESDDTHDEEQTIINADWEQYRAWLTSS